MKKIKDTTGWLLLGVMMLSYSTALAQEYDDMYFTKKDRKKTSFDLKSSSADAQETLQQYENEEFQAEYNAKEVNPDFLARYSSTKLGNNENINYGVTQEYYPEEGTEQPVVVNNYYGSNFNSPWVGNQWAPNAYMGWNNWTGFNRGFGNGFVGARAAFYNPWNDPFFYDPWFANSYYYDPWLNPWGFRNRWAFNNRWIDPWGPWGYRGTGYAIGFWDGYNVALFGPVGVAYRGYISERNVVRGARYSRGGIVTGISRSSLSTSGRRGVVAQNSNGRRDYSSSQNEYRNRSSRSSQTNNRAYSRSSSSGRVASSNNRAYSTNPSTSSGRSSGNSRSYLDRSVNNTRRSQNISRSSGSASSSYYSGRTNSNQSSGTTRRYSSQSGNYNRSNYSNSSSRSSSSSQSGYSNRSSSSSRSSGSRSSYSSGGSRSSYSGGSSSSGGSSRSSSGSSRSSGGRRGG